MFFTIGRECKCIEQGLWFLQCNLFYLIFHFENELRHHTIPEAGVGHSFQLPPRTRELLKIIFKNTNSDEKFEEKIRKNINLWHKSNLFSKI